jgi:nucleotide-binding universal stress UspA family protein
VHDLIVIDGEPEAVNPDRGLIEALLMDSGRPLIIVPLGRERLARHGVAVTVQNVQARDGDAAQTLRDVATLFRADMLIMGGYVHSRLREMFFGGVTQSLLKSSPLPLFMSY